ncbi:MAG: bifunctional UDP-N-acetylmuramoyl-tripeptide:D-alanyl-D-alanine ligase/alanine racemase [Cytophagaceae bacterium]
MLDFEKVKEVVKGTTLQFSRNLPVEYLLTDSRKVINPQNSLFFAIKGARHDGHRFIEELYQRGVRQFIVESDIRSENFPDSNILKVSSSIGALHQIAKAHRNKFSIPVIAITGSNGKTIVKEWLSQLLSIGNNIVRSPRSFNSQIGVPLSVWQINSQHTLGIFEAGISQPDEMGKLQEIIRPTIGVFTNILTAHDENFNSREEKVSEKLKLFKDAELLVYCSDYQNITDQLIQTYPRLKTLTWSKKNKADFQISELKKEITRTKVTGNFQGLSLHFILPFIDDASIENAMHCIAVLLHLKVKPGDIQKRISTLHPVGMRLELKEGINSCYIIDDTYNNDLAGLTIALNFLEQQNQKGIKHLILSDLLETGVEERKLYAGIADMLKSKGIERVTGIGEKIFSNSSFFPGNSRFYKSTEEFLKGFSRDEYSDEVILVKGARIFEFERIVAVLQQKVHGTVLEINLDALSENLNFYRSKLNPGTKVMVMVKAFAYGSGSFEVANLLQFHRVDYLAVAYTDEGVALRENGISIPIMVMNPSVHTFDKLFQYNLEPELYSFKVLNEYSDYLQKNYIAGKVHLKIDTGMRRLGFEEREVDELISQLKNNPLISVASVFTHLAAADCVEHEEFTLAQLKLFKTITKHLEDKIGYNFFKHVLNSAGITRFPQWQMDMVRLGIGLYGVEAGGLYQDKLQTVGTLKTIISQIKNVKKGETVGYSRKGVADKDIQIATIAIGYADGFDRRFSNGRGTVLIKGKLCPVIGNVCMDMTMIDISGVDAAEGDEVIIFGKQRSVFDLAIECGTIPYEILTKVGERVKRVFYTE